MLDSQDDRGSFGRRGDLRMTGCDFERPGAGEDARTTASLETGATRRSDSQGSDFIVLGWKFGVAQSEAAVRWPQELKPMYFSALGRHD